MFQNNGVTVKTENVDKNADKPGENNVPNVTIKQEVTDQNGGEMTNGTHSNLGDNKNDIKQENMKPPPEKKPRIL